MITDKQRERLEALLRLAEDPGTSQQERDLALERFTTLATRLQIDANAVNPHSGRYRQEDIVSHTFQVPASYGLGQTRYHGLYAVVMAMGANCYVNKEQMVRGRKKRRIVAEAVGLTVYAQESTMQALQVLIPSLVLQEANTSAAYIEQAKTEDSYLAALRDALHHTRRFQGNPKPIQNDLDRAIRLRRKSFCLAFFVEAAECVKTKRADAVQEAGRGYELALLDVKDRIRQSMDGLDLTTRKERKDARYSADGWENGTAAGKQAMVGQTELGGGRSALEK
jgi:hypothetical protein